MTSNGYLLTWLVTGQNSASPTLTFIAKAFRRKHPGLAYARPARDLIVDSS